MDVYLREGMQSRLMTREIVREKGASISDGDLDEIVAEKTKIFDREASANARAFDGVRGTLKLLRNNGLRVALVTGSKAGSAEKVLEAAGVRELFDVIVTGDDTKKGRPAPDPYLKAIKNVRVEPQDCVVVENPPPPGHKFSESSGRRLRHCAGDLAGAAEPAGGRRHHGFVRRPGTVPRTALRGTSACVMQKLFYTSQIH
jgi:HAD superfamily hydrolase (TIGR01509 family)